MSKCTNRQWSRRTEGTHTAAKASLSHPCCFVESLKYISKICPNTCDNIVLFIFDQHTAELQQLLRRWVNIITNILVSRSKKPRSEEAASRYKHFATEN